MIPYGKQDINQSDIDNVINTLTSSFLTQGPKVPEFENKISTLTDSKYSTAFSNATAALHIACLALEVGAGDIVWTTPISFVASSNCALYCGADVNFIDIDKETYNMCPKVLKEKLIEAKSKNQLPKVVIPVHLAGQSCDMKKIKLLSNEFGFKIIEDSSHAIGASYEDSRVGSCLYSDISIFSFHPVKIITTGEGGIATTNDPELNEKMKLLRSHGITKDSNKLSTSDGPWYYEQLSLGFNYRMTDLSAALGTSQLDRLDSFIQKRHELAKRYNLKLSGSKIKLPFQAKNTYSSFHLYIIRVPADKHKTIFSQLRDKNIGVNLHYIPIYNQPYYKKLNLEYFDCPNAEAYYSEAISIPLYPNLSITDQDFVIETLLNSAQE